MATLRTGLVSSIALIVASSSYPLAAQDNPLGQKLVEQYNNLPAAQKKPGGDCYAVAYDRVNKAVVAVCGNDAKLPKLTAFQTFDRLWGSKNDPKASWLKIEEKYRGTGAAGAMVQLGMGTMVSEDAIWNGKLQPGAVLQTWKKDTDFKKVRDGERPESIGHSFIFLEYQKNANGDILGMKIADQGTNWAEPNVLSRSTFEYWVGANIHCKK